MEEQYKRKNRSYSKVLVLVSVLFLVLYVPSFFIWTFGQTVETDYLRPSTYEDSIHTEAVIVRSETLVYAPVAGKVDIKKSEGEKVYKTSQVASVYDDAAGGIMERIAQLDKQILEAQKSKSGNDLLFSEDIAKLDNLIYNSIHQAVIQAERGYFPEIESTKRKLDGYVRKKAVISGELSPADKYIQSLVQERQGLQDNLSKYCQDIPAPSAGIVSYSLDGLEEKLRPDTISKISSGDLENLKQQNYTQLQLESVTTSQPFAKIIDNLGAYLVFAVDSGDVEDLTVDDEVDVRITEAGNMVVTGRIDYMTIEDSGKTVVSVFIDKAIDDTTRYRKLTVDLIKESIQGYRVPASALSDITYSGDGKWKAKILMVRFNYTQWVEVDVVPINKEFYMIILPENYFEQPVDLYEEYIVDAKKVPEGKRMR